MAKVKLRNAFFDGRELHPRGEAEIADTVGGKEVKLPKTAEKILSAPPTPPAPPKK